MASLSKDAKGHWRIQFYGQDGKRRTLRLGKFAEKRPGEVPKRVGVVLDHVEAILKAPLTGDTIPSPTLAWLNDIDPRFYARLAGTGLVAVQERSNLRTLAAFLDHVIEKKAAKGTTKTVYRRTRNHLVRHFGEKRLLVRITQGDADEFQDYLRLKGLADSTVRRTCGFARTFFKTAVKLHLIRENPFLSDSIRTTNTTDPTRQQFVSREDFQLVLDECPDHEWRVIAALARYGGLRIPSEIEHLKLTDIDWARNRVRITSPKTERYATGKERVIPLFPELRPYLQECWDRAPEGAVYVVETRRLKTNTNLRTQFNKIVARAGLTAWPKIFVNLRSSRQTELEAEFPTHVVCAWLGNSPDVARKHYLQITSADFDRASAVRKATPQVSAGGGECSGQKEKVPAEPGLANTRDSVQSVQMDDTGLEPVTSTMSTWRSNQLS